MKSSIKHTLSLSTRMFLIVFIISAIIFTFFAIHNYRSTLTTMQDQIIDSVCALNEHSLKIIDAYVNSVQNLCLLIAANKGTDAIEASQIVHLIQNFSRTSHPVAKTIYFVDNDGSVISNRQTYYDIMGNPMLTSMIDDAKNSLTGLVWSQPYHSPVSGSTVNFTHMVVDKYKKPIGAIVVELDLDYIQNDLDRQLDRTGYAYVLMTSERNPILFGDASGLLQYDHPILRNNLMEDFIKQLDGLPSWPTMITTEGCTLLATRSQAGRFGWNLYTLIDRHVLFQSTDSLKMMYLQAGIITLSAILCVSFAFSRYFTNPIRQLNNRMKQFSSSELYEPLAIMRRDEIGQLTASYNTMLLRIQHLIDHIKEDEKEKQRLEISMLQSQIQPHFLYNTLACISSLAKQKRTDEIRLTVESMINLFSYTFNKTAELMALGEEISAIQMYVQIQKIRYGDTFDIEYMIDEEAAGLFIPKLTLQPIIENAIFHGIRPCRHRGLIRITASVIDESLSITVYDNGTGIDPDIFSRILLNHYQQPLEKVSMNHVGLYNVNRRIALNFGDQYGISLEPAQQKGTCIKVLLPKLISKIPP